MVEAGAMRPEGDYTGVTKGPGTRRYRLDPVRNRLLTAAFVVSISVSLAANNWPQWRGPSLDGVSAEKGLPTTWSATENVAWKLPLPAFSGSTPVIWDDLVFLNVATERRTGSLELWAIDRNKRAVIWKRPLSDGNRIGNKQNMSSPSPVTDGRFVWVMTGTGILKAFDIAGKELWTRDIQKDYGPFGIQFGYASSPLLDGSSPVPAGTARDEHGRPVVRASHRQDDGEDRVAGRAANRRDRGVAGLVHDTGASATWRQTRKSSSRAATSSRAMIRLPARKCGAPTC